MRAPAVAWIPLSPLLQKVSCDDIGTKIIVIIDQDTRAPDVDHDVVSDDIVIGTCFDLNARSQRTTGGLQSIVTEIAFDETVGDSTCVSVTSHIQTLAFFAPRVVDFVFKNGDLVVSLANIVESNGSSSSAVNGVALDNGVCDGSSFSKSKSL